MASVSFLGDAIVSDSSTRTRSDAAATRLWVERLERFAAGNHTVVAFSAIEDVSEYSVTQRTSYEPIRPLLRMDLG